MPPFRKSLEALHGVIAAKPLSPESDFCEGDFANVRSPEFRDSLHQFFNRCRVDWPIFAERVQLAFDGSPRDPARFAADLMAKLVESESNHERPPTPLSVRAPVPQRSPHLEPDAVSFAIGWMADEPKPDLRAFKATVFLVECHGLSVFPGCRTLEDVIRLHDVPRSTFYAFRSQLRARGARLGPILPSDDA